MGKVLIKAPQTMMDSSGNVQYVYGNQEKGGDRGSLPARFLGGAGKVLGGALGATGPHQSLQSLIGGVQGGAAMGEQAGRWVGGLTDKLPGGRIRVKRRVQREGEADKFATQEAERRENQSFRERLASAPENIVDSIGHAVPYFGGKEKRRILQHIQNVADEQAQGAKDAELERTMRLRDKIRRDIKAENPSNRQRLMEAAAEAGEATGASSAEVARTGPIIGQGEAQPIIDTDQYHDTSQSAAANAAVIGAPGANAELNRTIQPQHMDHQEALSIIDQTTNNQTQNPYDEAWRRLQEAQASSTDDINQNNNMNTNIQSDLAALLNQTNQLTTPAIGG